MNMTNVSELVGLTCTAVYTNPDRSELTFETAEGRKFLMYHSQDCCESVDLEEIIGDLSDLVDTPMLVAEERTGNDPPPPEAYVDDVYAWTFYEFRTIKGSVTLRWFGTSNGYYSVDVDFREIKIGG